MGGRQQPLLSAIARRKIFSRLRAVGICPQKGSTHVSRLSCDGDHFQVLLPRVDPSRPIRANVLPPANRLNRRIARPGDRQINTVFRDNA